MSRRAAAAAWSAAALALVACVQAPPAPQPAGEGTAAHTAAAIALIGQVQGNAQIDVPPDQVRPPTGERPLLDPAMATRMDVADYLAQGPSRWQPESLSGITWRPDFTVALDGRGSHGSVQAAIDAVPQRSAAPGRVVIRIKPGVYRERVCVPAGKAPITLVGDPSDASAVIVVGSAYGGQAKRPGVDSAHPCQPDLALPIFGTLGSATVIVAADDFQAVHLTIANDAMEHVRLGVRYPPGASESGGAQGVALTTQADRVQLENLRLIGHQDTLQARRPTPQTPARVLVRGSLIAGDVDFIFGNATLVIDDSTILNRGGRRRPPNGGHVLAPSTPAGVAFGFLVTRSRFLAEPGTPLAHISLGRAWDEGVPRGEWKAGVSPNGQALIRDSLLGPHLALQAPWAASTSRRPFTAQGAQAARMTEFNNTVLSGNPQAREVLSPWDGWGAAAGGVTGGAAASAGDMHLVRNRAELAAALAPHTRPRIVQIAGRIDLSVDDRGRPLGYEDYRDPAFDLEAFVRAYDPAVWGKRKPHGPLEEARLRSARRQSERVILRVPSDTTLIGLGHDAHIIGGSLMLERVRNVIVRNLRFSDAYDHFPAWDPNDNASGEWNSEYDNLSLRGATNVWVDHCRFDDGERLDRDEPARLGRRVQHHDGLLDITHASDFITVSWSHFRHHDKTMLVGNGDNRTDDAGHLRVTLHHNLFEQVSERTPRVRFGAVHVYNNLFVTAADSPYPFGYSLGIGFQSRLFSERNVWETPPTVPAGRLARVYKGQTFLDRESLHNGGAVDLLAALQASQPGLSLSNQVGWWPALVSTMDPASEVAANVRASVGVGRLAKPAP